MELLCNFIEILQFTRSDSKLINFVSLVLFEVDDDVETHVCSSAACVCVFRNWGQNPWHITKNIRDQAFIQVFIEEIGFDRLLFFYYLLFTTFINAHRLKSGLKDNQMLVCK